MKSTILLSILAVAASANPVAKRQERTFTIKSVSYGGTGCPQGSIKPVINGNRVKLEGHFTASQKPGGSIIERRRNCQVGLDVTFNAPWTTAKIFTTYMGELNLDAATKGTLSQTYYISGQTTQGKADRSFDGPINTGYWMISNLAIPNAGPACQPESNESLQINTQAIVAGDASKNATGLIYVDFKDSEISMDVDWDNKC